MPVSSDVLPTPIHSDHSKCRPTSPANQQPCICVCGYAKCVIPTAPNLPNHEKTMTTATHLTSSGVSPNFPKPTRADPMSTDAGNIHLNNNETFLAHGISHPQPHNNDANTLAYFPPSPHSHISASLIQRTPLPVSFLFTPYHRMNKQHAKSTAQ